MKNWNIRKKMVPIYGVITVFTFLLFFFAYGLMKRIAEGGDADATLRLFVIAFCIYIPVYIAIVYLTAHQVAKQVAYPAKDLVQAVEKLAVGDVDVTLTHDTRDEMGVLTAGFRRMVDSMKDQAHVLETIATGDYTPMVSQRSDGDVINRAIMDILDNNNKLVSEMRAAAVQVAQGARQIAQSAQDLSDGSAQQASSVEEFSATLAGVMQQSAGNAEASQQALEVTRQTTGRMQEGAQSMEQVSAAMRSIDQSSSEISKVTKVIEDIAFQTNILALNAAVEAARAGEHGKGFAVVADEVRNLAGKSAEAARETTALIEGSSRRVAEGNEVVSATNEALGTVGALAGETGQLVDGISRDSGEQSRSISELNAAIEQISGVVQATSATAEECAAAAQEMSAQSQLLTSAVARFKLREDARALPPRHVG